MEIVKIVALTVLLACVYGIVHDQVTARVCVEYFTVGHPRIIASESPTMLALAWGVVATWWVGVILGVPLALVAQLGSGPRLTARQLVRPILILLLVMGVIALTAGIVGWSFASSGRVRLAFGAPLSAETQVRFIADWWAHLASYASGFLGGIALIVYVAVKRRRLRREMQ
jgi:hypothetical protein